MATVRIYLPTYRRGAMLQRALASLRAQTFTDWVCEVHNDQPGDPVPAQLVRETGDPRFQMVEHARNLGGTGTFNLFFQPPAEPFYSIHEDDNTWEPALLETLVATARAHPKVVLFWANMHIAEEQGDGGLRQTGRTVWPVSDDPVRLLSWGDSRQVVGALHSNGAALFRSRAGDDFRIPAVPFGVIEPFRERMFPHPLALVPRPLATFVVTQQTARGNDRRDWAEMQAMLAATFFHGATWDESAIAAFWAEARARQPAETGPLIYAAIADSRSKALLRHAHARDWWLVLRGFLRRPGTYFRLRRSRRTHPDWWQFLETQTARRWAEAKSA